MSGGRILAVNEKFGYRPVLTVKNFNFLPQFQNRAPSTWFYGVQMMSPYDDPTIYLKFLTPMIGESAIWSQVGLNDDETEEQVFANWPRLPLRLVANDRLTLVAAGRDPVAGYYCQFAGSTSLFSRPDWWKDGMDIQF